MADASVYLLNFLRRPRTRNSSRGFFFILIATLTFSTSLFVFSCVSSTSRLLINDIQNVHLYNVKPPVDEAVVSARIVVPTKPIVQIALAKPTRSSVLEFHISNHTVKVDDEYLAAPPLENGGTEEERSTADQIQFSEKVSTESIIEKIAKKKKNREVFHDREIFLENYKEMNRSLKIYIYPHQRNHPFANVLLPVSHEPGGNYASESYFKKALAKSHFVTNDPSEADFFFLPFSLASMRHDRRIGVAGIQDFVRDYVDSVRREYPYWNRTGGADHFYVACHSIGKTAMDKAAEVRANAVQVVCSSNYFVSGFVPHKDVSLPQIWPRHGDPPLAQPSKRTRLAFFAGASNSPVRKELVEAWRNDADIFAHSGRLKTPYSTELLRSKFCLHAKGYEVNTARIGDALYYGCVPVVLADHYDLPFEDILNWESFSVVVATADIPQLKKILKEISFDEYARLQSNVLKVRTHFQWHSSPIEYDAFNMVMYELWLRRSSYVRII